MSEPDLTITYAKLRESIAFYLGYGRDDTAWSSDQAATINDMLDRGLRQFYQPPVVSSDPDAAAHRWSFINITGVVDMMAGTTVHELPDNFGGISSVFTYERNTGWWQITQVDEEMVRIQEQTVDSTHIPHWFALRPKAQHDATIGQRYELVFYPTPDANYRLRYRYRLSPNKLTATNIYHHGLGLHGQTLEAACLACCELFVEDKRGEQWGNFVTQLKQSISIDAEVEPSYIGYNADHSDTRDGMDGGDFHEQLRSRRGGSITFTNGTQI